MKNNETKKNLLTGKQNKVIAALLNHATIAATAQAAKVAETTIYEWLSDPIFQNTYHAYRRQAFDQGMSQLQMKVVEAVGILQTIMHDKSITASSRVSAATNIINIGLKFAAIDNLIERVEILEAKLAAQAGSSNSSPIETTDSNSPDDEEDDID
ncbi:MAG: hypothetical protein GY869_30750 [Planctomycetes bacterium]|nr:hypothetical protein [Planctomycetota bacterium]